uniref:Uncharacterized protein n=1 Tax=Rhizophora mucronata TaxID=61149 RepID=A0A2P2JD73_RHIMU
MNLLQDAMMTTVLEHQFEKARSQRNCCCPSTACLGSPIPPVLAGVNLKSDCSTKSTDSIS